MAKLILHIGYPKTATTSLQEGCFVKLHEKGIINYLGRTVKSTHSSSIKSQFKGIDWAVEIRKKFLFGRKFSNESLTLREDIINVLSDEDLSIHPYFHLAQFGVNVDTHKIAYILKDIIPVGTEIVVLLTIRNQANLIKSCFLQKYRFIYLYDKGLSFHNFLYNNDNCLNEMAIRSYDFSIIAKHYMKVLDAQIRILFFEDIRNDPESFFSLLGSIIQVPTNDLINLMENAHFRNRSLKSNSESVNVTSSAHLGKFIELFIGKEKFRFYWAKKTYMRKSLFVNFFNKLFLGKKRVPYPNLNQFDSKSISESFYSFNLAFAKEFGCSIEKMQKYGYI